MALKDIARARLFNQHIARPTRHSPADIVRWLGAVQAQDYAAAKWALGLRSPGLSDSAIEQAFAAGSLLRTHVMRPTWHFVAPEDIRWLLALTAPRVHAANAYQYRALELEAAVFKRSHAALTRALRDGRQLTRGELASVLQRAGIQSTGLRLNYLLIRSELDGLICSGARRGKQFTYALLDERVPEMKALPRDEALAQLTRRYFASRGPATEQDFMWWSGLTRADVRKGIEMLGRQLAAERTDGGTYWHAASTAPARLARSSVYLLPNFDEYVVGYTDRSAIFDDSHTQSLDARQNPLFQHMLVINGQIAGTWKRTLHKDAVLLDLKAFAPLKPAERQAAAAAADKYGAFLGLPAVLAKTTAGTQ